MAHRKRTWESRQDASPACAPCRARKVRCDREQPECSNCRKNGVSCDFSLSSKRVNHTKELAHEFSSVVSRLEQIEKTLHRLAEELKLSRESHGQHQLQDAPALGDSQQQGDRRVQSYPASLSLFRSIHRRLACALNGRSIPEAQQQQTSDLWTIAAQNHALRPILKRQLDSFPLSAPCVLSDIASDHQSISTPPRALVELSVDAFLKHINSHVPIFDDSALRDAIDQHYASAPPQRCRAQALSFSNIVLLTMALDSRVLQAASPTEKCLDDDLTMSLLRNCNRALKSLDLFSVPSLANLRALLTLVLVSQEFYNSLVVGQVCRMACRVVRALGLQNSSTHHSKSWQSIPEHERLFWVVYTLDKQQLFLSGLPCDLYVFDTGLSLPPCDEKTERPQHLHAAFVSLISIWEEIYLALYSLRSNMAGDSTRGRQIERLRSLLGTWEQTYQPLLRKQPSESTPSVTILQLELQYGFEVGQILVQRCDHTATPRQRYRDPARAALETIGQVAREPATPQRCVVLARILRNYPLVAFYDLFFYCITAAESEMRENATLLHETRCYLEPLQHPNFPDSYYNKMYSALNWSTQQLDILSTHLSNPDLLSAPGNPPEMNGMPSDVSFDKDLAVSGAGPGTPDLLLHGIDEYQGGLSLSESFFDIDHFLNCPMAWDQA